MNNQDFVQAHRDALLIRAGLRSASDPGIHPEAIVLASGDGNLVEALAEFCGNGAVQARVPGYSGGPSASGITQADFGAALGGVLRVATVAGLTANTRHEQLCARIDVRDFLPRSFPSVALDTDLALVNELGEFKQATLSATGGLTAQIKTFGRNIAVSRRALLADDIGLIVRAFKNFGAAAARLEAKLIYGLIESNPTLSDAESMFNAPRGNILASALNEATLGEAMGMLRALPDPFGEKQNLDAAVLAVEGKLEAPARRIVKDTGLDLEVVASPWLAAGRWYVLPSPDVAPVVGLLRLAGSKHPATVGPHSPRSDTSASALDGAMFGVRVDTGVVALGRTAIRGGV